MIDLDLCKYDNFMLPIVECLQYSPLTIALTKMENVPISLLSKAYSSASFIKEEQRIVFEIHNRKTSISKSRFCSVIGLPQSDNMINPESVSNAALLEMFYQTGYKENLDAVFISGNLICRPNGMASSLYC